MFDIGWSEIMMIVAVAIIVVGPKDLPKLLRTISNFVKKARSMVRDVQSQIEEVADISELKEEAQKLKNMDFASPDELATEKFDLEAERQKAAAQAKKDNPPKSDQKEVNESSEEYVMK